MDVRIGRTTLSLVKGDITAEKVDAIVNAANSRLAGGGGVDGAIHRRGGPSIMEECRRIGGCPTGDAVATGAGELDADYVIHAVGPIYRGGTKGEERLLASAYRRSLEVARHKGCRSIAFPSLSTGAYGYPVEEASMIALKTVMDYIKDKDWFELVKFVLFTDKDLETYTASLKRLIEKA